MKRPTGMLSGFLIVSQRYGQNNVFRSTSPAEPVKSKPMKVFLLRTKVWAHIKKVNIWFLKRVRIVEKLFSCI